MTSIRFQSDSLRSEAVRLLAELKAISLLTHPVSPTQINAFGSKRAEIDEANRRDLRDVVQHLNNEVQKVREFYKTKVSSDELLRSLAFIERGAITGDALFVPIWVLLDWFPGLRSKPLELLPRHAQIEVNPTGRLYSRPHKWFNIRLLEATLFEDMCALFNMARESHLQKGDRDDKRTAKYRISLFRAVAVSVFNMLEAFLNGLAADFVLGNQQLDDEERDFLTEWDSKKGRAKFVSLRDKLLKYPRMIAGTEHPLLQESNCSEMKFILDVARKFRDSTVHASSLYRTEMPFNKDIFVHSISFEDVEKIVDATVILVEKIEQAIYGSEDRIRFWRAKRLNGCFPETAFD